MITWLVGENSFEVHEALKQLERAFDGRADKIDGADLSLADLPNILMGVSLFAPQRMVVIDGISTNSHLWEKLPEWLPRVSDDIHVVFVDTKPDKRTTSYKALKEVATIHEHPAWTDRDTTKAEQWVSARASQQNIVLDRSLVRQLVARVGIDQWKLAQALETLSLLDTVTEQAMIDVIPANPQENIFQLFETALEGDRRKLAGQLKTMMLQEDPYALFALLSSQALSLAAITFADETANPSKEFGIHPFVASKMSRHAQKLGKTKVARILQSFARTDADMKRSKGEPWLLLERTLLEVAQ